MDITAHNSSLWKLWRNSLKIASSHKIQCTDPLERTVSTDPGTMSVLQHPHSTSEPFHSMWFFPQGSLLGFIMISLCMKKESSRL